MLTPIAGGGALPASAPAATVQISEPVSELLRRSMEKSRAKAWAESADIAERAAARADATALEKAEACCLVALARAQLGDKDAAKAAITTFDSLSERVPAEHWSRRYMEGDLRKELGLAPKQPGPPANPVELLEGADTPTAVWTVRSLNLSGDHAQAAAAAELVLKRPDLYPQGRCDVLMHLAFAAQKTGQADRAAEAFTAFAAAADALERSDPLKLEMAELRKALGLPALPGLKVEASVHEPPREDSYWKVAPPAAEDVDGTALEQLRTLCERSGADGVLVARRGNIVMEWYSPLYRDPMMTMSSAKSITGLLAGILISEGKVGIDDPLSRYVPSWNEGRRAGVTVRHLLTMTGGLTHVPSVRTRVEGEGWNGFAERQTPVTDPGTAWAYTNEGVQLLSPVLEKAAGEPLWSFAKRRLFEPIGATSTQMWRDEKGVTNTYADARTTLREFARFGELVRLRGAWPGAGQVVPKEWIATMTTPCERSNDYGMLWWLTHKPRTWSMRGFLNTDVYVFPDLDLVVARTQARPYLHATEKYSADEMVTLIERACR
ncbi:MAG TPA: serine hydrolase [Phycisphaerales bacterium]|nr:serine hydrolase [Phycisphaerales bacterium]